VTQSRIRLAAVVCSVSALLLLGVSQLDWSSNSGGAGDQQRVVELYRGDHPRSEVVDVRCQRVNTGAECDFRVGPKRCKASLDDVAHNARGVYLCGFHRLHANKR
jgi:hypothetical protein